jgi:hypothetical protein
MGDRLSSLVDRSVNIVAIKIKIRSTKSEIAVFQTNPKFKYPNDQKIPKSFNKGAYAPGVIVLNFVF